MWVFRRIKSGRCWIWETLIRLDVYFGELNLGGVWVFRRSKSGRRWIRAALDLGGVVIRL